MLKKAIKNMLAILGFALGFGLSMILMRIFNLNISSNSWEIIAIQLIVSLFIGLVFYLYSQKIIDKWKKYMRFIERELEDVPLNEIVLGSFGLIVSLVIANLLSKPLEFIGNSYINFMFQTALYIGLGYLGIKIMTRKREDVSLIGKELKSYNKKEYESFGKKNNISIPKILDTKAIIDGRIADICKTGFIEGPLVIGEFVLLEIQKIADSTDDLKRKQGRRGLDTLNEIQKDIAQKELDLEVIINYDKFDEIESVDSKLLELAKTIKGKIITTDNNLNKVAAIHGINVLNINEMANALKPVVIPGEEIEAHVSNSGKENGQGVAYMNDGTMIVIEAGGNFIGKTIDVVVTSALQTSAGRMVFAKLK